MIYNYLAKQRIGGRQSHDIKFGLVDARLINNDREGRGKAIGTGGYLPPCREWTEND